MDRPGDWTETARRIRAAMAYGRLTREAAAEAMGTRPGTLDRIIGTKGGETRAATWEQLWRLAERASLPPEWFSADFARLREIVPPGLPTVVPGEGLPDTTAVAPTIHRLAAETARRRRRRG